MPLHSLLFTSLHASYMPAWAFFLLFNSSILLAKDDAQIDAAIATQAPKALPARATTQVKQIELPNSNASTSNISTSSTSNSISKQKADSKPSKSANTAALNNNKQTALSEQEQAIVQQAIESTAPMSPAALQSFSEALYQRSLVGSEPPGGPYTVRNRMVKMKLSPGSVPETISMALGQGVVVAFVDRNGQPLIIDSVKSHSKAFSIYVPETEAHSNMGASSFAIESKSIAAVGNVSILLKGTGGQSAPIILLLESGRNKEIDGVVQLVHPTMLNPQGQINAGDSMSSEAEFALQDLQAFLTGVPPESATEIHIQQSMLDVYAWKWGNKLYLKTIHPVISPAWLKRQAAIDGTAVYELPLTPLLRLSVRGQDVELVLELPYIASKGGKP